MHLYLLKSNYRILIAIICIMLLFKTVYAQNSTESLPLPDSASTASADYNNVQLGILLKNLTDQNKINETLIDKTNTDSAVLQSLIQLTQKLEVAEWRKFDFSKVKNLSSSKPVKIMNDPEVHTEIDKLQQTFEDPIESLLRLNNYAKDLKFAGEIKDIDSRLTASLESDALNKFLKSGIADHVLDKEIISKLEVLTDMNAFSIWKKAVIETADRDRSRMVELVAEDKKQQQLAEDRIAEIKSHINAFTTHLTTNQNMATYVLVAFAAVAAIAIIASALPLFLQNRTINEYIDPRITTEFILELTTVFLLSATVVILGVGDKIRSDVLGALLGSIAGYVLGRNIKQSGGVASLAKQLTSTGPNNNAPGNPPKNQG